ncbi:MAG: noncanonical pyrimidine nucleotidase, YjjG family [Bacteroidales bacterium]|nr:noncanonical pyrimidine nucleotidase, YjjG family [Bacteroidales bacterium]
MKTYKHLFFDLDRTLYDFESASKHTLSDIYTKHNLQEFYKDFNQFYEIYKNHNYKLWVDYRNKKISKDKLNFNRFYNTLLEVGENNENLACKMSKDYINIIPNKCILFPDTHEVLTYLKSKYKLYIITNGFKEVQYKKIRKCNLNHYFDKTYISEEVGYNKPDNKYFQHVMQDCGAKINDCLVIGDDLDVDIQGAINSNIDSVWFNSDNIYSELPATFKIESLKDLKEIL